MEQGTDLLTKIVDQLGLESARKTMQIVALQEELANARELIEQLTPTAPQED